MFINNPQTPTQQVLQQDLLNRGCRIDNPLATREDLGPYPKKSPILAKYVSKVIFVSNIN